LFLLFCYIAWWCATRRIENKIDLDPVVVGVMVAVEMTVVFLSLNNVVVVDGAGTRMLIRILFGRIGP
jgi:hypothetical protein